MDIGSLTVLTTIYKLADSCGLLNYVKDLPEKTADALYSKLVQDTVFENHINAFFQSDIQKSFQSALKKVGPVNESIKRKFLLAILSDPEIASVVKDLAKGKLPQRDVFIPVFQQIWPKDEIKDKVDGFVDTFYGELKKDQDFVNSVVLSMYELIGKQHQQLLDRIETAFKETPPQKTKKQFKVETTKLPVTSSQLFGREKELAILDNAFIRHWDTRASRV